MGEIFKACKIPIGAWYGDNELELTFPDTWEINFCANNGYRAKQLTDNEIKRAFRNPIGSKTISKLAEGKEEVVIIVSDNCRPDPHLRTAPLVLEELNEAGISDEHIRFVVGVGAHRATTREDWHKKIGEEMVERIPVFNHDCQANVVEVGTTERGTPVKVNREVMDCDLKLGLGGIIPHGGAGFGGGGKIILPGVVSKETIFHNHAKIRGGGHGNVTTNQQRFDMEETARLAGLDLKVDVLVNGRRQVAGAFVGDFVEEHRAGCDMATKHYSTVTPKNMDVVVTNSYPIEDEMGKAMFGAYASVKPDGDVVLIGHNPEGNASHILGGQWGTNYGGAIWEIGMWKPSLAGKMKRLIVFSPYLSKVDLNGFAKEKEMVVGIKNWEEVIEELVNSQGNDAKVAVYPCADMQMAQK